MSGKPATPCYTRLHRRGLTLPQQNAVDLLASGKNDTETAAAVGVNRVTVTRWRLYDPVFQAALNALRRETWGVSLERLRGLIPMALDALAEILSDAAHPGRLKVALVLLDMMRPGSLAPTGPTDAEDIVRGIVKARRSNAPGLFDEMFEEKKNLPPFDRQLAEVWEELEALATDTSDPEGAAPDQESD
jgi:hypothetical protein